MVPLDLNRYLEISVGCQAPSSEAKEISGTILTIGGVFGYLHSFASSVIGRVYLENNL